MARIKVAKTAGFLSALLALGLSCARADWRLDAEAGVVNDSNLSNSDRAADEETDWAWKGRAAIGDGFQLTRDLRLSLVADLHGQIWNQYNGFDLIGGGAAAGLRYRFGLGPQAPWILLENRIGYDRFRETARSGWDEALHLRAGIAVAPRVALEAGYSFDKFSAPDNFFDLQGHRGSARVIVDLTSALQIGLEYSYRDGEVISYAVPPRPDIVRQASELRPIATFGASPLYTAYRLRAQTHAVSVFAGYALTKFLSVQLSYQYAATSHDPLQYEKHLVEAKIALAY